MLASKLSPAGAFKKLKPAESEQRHLISLFLSLFLAATERLGQGADEERKPRIARKAEDPRVRAWVL